MHSVCRGSATRAWFARRHASLAQPPRAAHHGHLHTLPLVQRCRAHPLLPRLSYAPASPPPPNPCSLPLAKESRGGGFSWLGFNKGAPATIQDCLTAFTADEKLEVGGPGCRLVWCVCLFEVAAPSRTASPPPPPTRSWRWVG